ncbi:hypothetical protein SAMN05421670_0961 [Psychrobacillus psychrotolerans]|uniref:SbsC C-terminal domain-containing protein n=1 Tax=Psychrobacillus psychrotolerans TaxID=126156 RepID=A0A1I5VT69_9BACI|nr:hypothetical protein [Psychrobacillus psychrotolerans]SFQ10794.1 hypothetical protein SAMN05421670_0961 [Psychrobacillus psychrotolerans]
MKKWKFLSIVIILAVFMMILPSNNSASSLSEAEKLVQKAENAATALKWEISLEHRKTIYSDPVSLPNMNLYNTTKNASQLAYQVLKTLPAQEKAKLTKRMESNVDIHLNRSMAYIDAITSGKKITVKTDNLYEAYRLNPLSDQTEKAYHDLSSEIRKQAILLYRVYGKSTRNAILDKYKSPGEKVKESTKSVISVKMTIDQLQQSIAKNKNTEELLSSVKQIETTVNTIQDENARQLLHIKLDKTKKAIEGDGTFDQSFFYLSELTRKAVIHPSQPIIYALNENKDVLEINYETRKVRRLTMNLVPETIYFQNNELYVALLKSTRSSYLWEEYQKGAIAIINATSFKLVEQFNINIDPFDIVADDKSIYVSSGSGQWGNILGYSRETLLETSKSESVYDQSFLEMHPNLDRLYSIDTTISPRDVDTHLIDDGKIITGYDSPYHGKYELDTNMAISPDGKYIFNGSGVVMIATEAEATDMRYLMELYTPFEQITFNLKDGFFYTSDGKGIDVYNYNTMEREKHYEMSGKIQNLFYQNGKLVVVSVEELYSSKLPTYAIKTYNVVGNKVIQY